MELLPLLFHRNTPALPGFVSSDTPAGIRDYVPSKIAINAAKSLSKSFVYKRRALKHYPIDAIYLMGSVGNIDYSNKSDIDIWLCYQSDIDLDLLDELQEKVDSVEKWAVSLRLDARFFLFDTAGFSQSKSIALSRELNSGVQHHLLLEDFYRTGLHLAGKIPAWWLVPPEQERDYDMYVAHLKDKRFVDEHEVIDFGSLNNVRPDEILNAGAWHLYKSISSPYQNMLKLLLIEAYAKELPYPMWLCLILKKAIFEGSVDVNQLDSYTLTLTKVEKFLGDTQDIDRLNLIRSIFFIKINTLLSENTRYTPRQFRRDVLRTAVERWGWSSRYVAELDNHAKWKYQRVSQELQLIGAELMRSYRFLSQFASGYGYSGQSENGVLKLVGRKLNACLERKPGKIDTVFTAKSFQLAEPALTLREIELADDEKGWGLYVGYLKDTAVQTLRLKKSRNILETLAWATLNGLYAKQTYLFYEADDNAIKLREVQAMSRDLNRFFFNNMVTEDSLDSFRGAAHNLCSVLFINIGIDPMNTGTDGSQIASNRSDALSYSSLRTNLVLKVDAVAISSWQEVLLQSYAGLHGLLDCLLELINHAPTGQKPPKVACFSYGSTRSRSIANRVNQLYKQLSSRFSIAFGSLRLRYVLRGAHKFYLVHNHNGSLSYLEVANETQLLLELSQSQAVYSRVKFDSEALDDSPLPLIFDHHRPGKIQIFFRKRRKKTDIYILDERGSLFNETRATINLKPLSEPFYYFLFSTVNRHMLSFSPSIEYFFVEKEPNEPFELKPINLDMKSEATALTVRVVGHGRNLDQTDYTIYCDAQEFSSMEYGQDLFQAVAHHIVGLRQSKNDYPVYITDIDVPHTILGVNAPSELQTIHFLKYKQKIESRLNEQVFA